MPLELFNTLSRKVEAFKPIHAGEVGLYTCGPTVYNFAHIGNLRTYLFEDLLKRALLLQGWAVRHVMNITDVGHLTSDADTGEDKMEAGAAREGKSIREIADFYTRAFQDDLKALRILPPTVWCRATDHIPEQIAMVEGLLAKGYAYRLDDGVYFDTARFPGYGRMARKDLEGQIAGARVEQVGGKRNPSDFALWKFSPAGSRRLMEWPSPFGTGFPGWHLECSAMALKYLGDHFDIHCGGIDHIPVHHTNEIAQTEAFTGKSPWVDFWLHGEFLVLDKGKMSKSAGGFLTLARVREQGYDPLDYRYLCLSAHYRSPLLFSFESLDQARAGRRHLAEDLSGIPREGGIPEADARALELGRKFMACLDEDLNAPRALAVAWDLAKDKSLAPAQKSGLLRLMEAGLGLDLLALPAEAPEAPLSAEEQGLLEARQSAKQARDFAAADRLRRELAERGVLIEDTPQGPRWKRKAS